MAESKPAAKPADAGEAGAKKKKNPKMMILAVAALVLLLGGGAAAFVLLRPAPSAATGDAAKAGEGKPGDGKKPAEKKGENKKPTFVESEMFTVNLKDPEKFLQIKLTFQVATPDIAESLKEMMPVVRSALIPVLSSQDPLELNTSEGKEKMRAEVVAASNKALAGGEVAQPVDDVLIAHMIIQ